MKRSICFLWSVICLGLLFGCRPPQRSADVFTKDIYRPRYASGFQIKGTERQASTLIAVRNPWQGAEEVQMLYFISRNGELSPSDFKGQVIQAGARRIVCMSSSYIAMLDMLGQADRIIGVSGLDFVSNAYVNAHKAVIRDMGVQPDYETLVGLRPDVVLLYGIDDAQSTLTGKLDELGIPYMYMAEYLEELPLGKSEWLVVVGELTDHRDKAVTAFHEMESRYNRLKQQVCQVKRRPTVMLNAPWNDQWIMPSVRSYMVRLIADAGGDYIYKRNTSTSSQNMGMEMAYKLLSEADFWLNVGTATTLAELKAMNPRFAGVRSMTLGQVYNNNRRLTPGGGNDYWESAVVQPDLVLNDLIRIFHPECSTDSLYYYRRLK